LQNKSQNTQATNKTRKPRTATEPKARNYKTKQMLSEKTQIQKLQHSHLWRQLHAPQINLLPIQATWSKSTFDKNIDSKPEARSIME
jgi:hypothetical protein